MPVVRIEADVGKNRLRITLSGKPSEADAAATYEKLDAELARLRPPIDVLSDIRGLEELGPELVEQFKSFGRRLGRFGVRRSVRIVGRSAQAAVHMERLARHLKGHAAHLAFSEAEAEAAFSK